MEFGANFGGVLKRFHGLFSLFSGRYTSPMYVRFNPHAHGEANSTFLEIPCYPRGVSSFFCSKFLPKFNLISVKKYPPKNHLKMDGKGRRPFPFWGKRPIFRGELAVSFRGGSILNQFPTSMCELTSNHGTAIQLCHACFVDLLDLQVVVEKNHPKQTNDSGTSPIFPQIAIAIGVLTSNRGEGDEPLWRIGRGTRVPLQGAVDVVPLLGAIVGYHCSVLWLGGRVTTNFNFEGMDLVPSLGAIACHCSVLWWGRGG